MKTSTEVSRIFNFKKSLGSELNKTRIEALEHIWHACEEWKYFELKEKLRTKEMLGFLLRQRQMRVKGTLEKLLHEKKPREVIRDFSIQGMKILDRFKPEPDLFFDFSEEEYREHELLIERKLADYDSEDELHILLAPPATALYKEDMRDFNTSLIQKGITYLDAIKNQGLIISSPLEDKGPLKGKRHLQKQWRIARILDEERPVEVKYEPEKRIKSKESRIHLSTRHMLVTHDDWRDVFKPAEEYNVFLAHHFVRGFVDLENERPDELANLVKTYPFSVIVPLLAKTEFYKNALPDNFRKTLSYSPEDFLSFYIQPDKYTRHFLQPFTEVISKKTYRETEIAMEPEKERVTINPTWFDNPTHQIMSPNRAKKSPYANNVVQIQFYCLAGSKMEDDTRAIVERRMVNGVREYVRDALDARGTDT